VAITRCHVSGVLDVCVQVFYLDVVYVAMTIYVCCKHMFLGVSNICFKCFIWMLQKYIRMLHNMHVASVLGVLYVC
jgi:hypothetical protein